MLTLGWRAMDGENSCCMLSTVDFKKNVLGANMREVFSHHFASDHGRRENLWENCLFVFDTNVLTGIYRRSEEARDAQYKMMVALGDRLWVPYRVIYEFLDNRAKIVHDQAQLYAASISELKGILSSFEVVTRHPFLSSGVYHEFSLASQKVLTELEVSRQFHDGRITNDDVKGKLAEILAGKVGPNFTEERLVEIVKEGEQRYAQNIPPGFEDRGKHKGSSITEEIRKRYGDLIIWNQIVEKAKAEQRPVILVTGDQKPDWWAEQSGKTLGPHPALLEEFKKLSGQDFYLYSYHGFLDLANQYLDQKTSDSVIQEVRDSALLDAVEFEADTHHREDEAVVEYRNSLGERRIKFYGQDLDDFTGAHCASLLDREARLVAQIAEIESSRSARKKLLSITIASKLPDSTVRTIKKDVAIMDGKLIVLFEALNDVRAELNSLRGGED